jgi:hypothetical protein
MNKESAYLALLPAVGNNVLTFSCYHDEMFVYELETPKFFLEITFLPNDQAGLLNEMSLEDLLDDVDFSKFFESKFIND